jgi:C4-dicarboxylate transporter DctM subunit
VLGSIYAGIATATEAAAVGVVGALAISARRAR